MCSSPSPNSSSTRPENLMRPNKCYMPLRTSKGLPTPGSSPFSYNTSRKNPYQSNSRLGKPTPTPLPACMGTRTLLKQKLENSKPSVEPPQYPPMSPNSVVLQVISNGTIVLLSKSFTL